MNETQLKNILEAALLAADKPMSVSNLLGLFKDEPELPKREDLRAVLKALQEDYIDRGVELVEVASGFRFQVRSDYSVWINRMFEDRPPRYSRALLETIAIIAYRQPITRAEIEEIRGVSISSSILKTLQEREWIRVVGHRDVPGKPELLATTREFLDYFNIKKLSELPSLAEIKDFDQMNPDLFEGIEPQITIESATPDVSQEDIAKEIQEEEQKNNTVTLAS
ncbi:MAG: SMC-Scp complex subunit ScpB [Thiotrichales bacterium]|nr:SMC-Scp complex subunit ScpB [Thiotrichales bacterium]